MTDWRERCEDDYQMALKNVKSRIAVIVSELAPSAPDWGLIHHVCRACMESKIDLADLTLDVIRAVATARPFRPEAYTHVVTISDLGLPYPWFDIVLDVQETVGAV